MPYPIMRFTPQQARALVAIVELADKRRQLPTDQVIADHIGIHRTTFNWHKLRLAATGYVDVSYAPARLKSGFVTDKEAAAITHWAWCECRQLPWLGMSQEELVQGLTVKFPGTKPNFRKLITGMIRNGYLKRSRNGFIHHNWRGARETKYLKLLAGEK